MDFRKAGFRYRRHLQDQRRLVRTFAQLRGPVLVQGAVDLVPRHFRRVSQFVEAIATQIRGVKPGGRRLARPGKEAAPIGPDRAHIAVGPDDADGRR